MVEEASGLHGADLVADEDERATAVAERRIDQMVERRIAGEPLQYVLGSWSFRGIDLFVDPRVLIPRPETEVTAQVAIDEAARLGADVGRRPAWSGTTTSYVVADLGTGSGALALALAAELPDAEVWATDRSADALAVARANLAGAGSTATRVRVAEGSWFDALPDGAAWALARRREQPAVRVGAGGRRSAARRGLARAARGARQRRDRARGDRGDPA